MSRSTSQSAAGIIAEEPDLPGAALLSGVDQFASALNHLPMAVYVVDADFKIYLVNPMAHPVFGDIPKLIGQNFDDVIHILNSMSDSERGSIGEAARRRVASTERVWNYSHCAPRYSGRTEAPLSACLC